MIFSYQYSRDVYESPVGYSISNGVLVAPTSDQLAAIQKKSAIAKAELTKVDLMAGATAAISPLQDAVDLGVATDDERVQLAAWKQYRILLNRIGTSVAPAITWPDID